MFLSRHVSRTRLNFTDSKEQTHIFVCCTFDRTFIVTRAISQSFMLQKAKGLNCFSRSVLKKIYFPFLYLSISLFGLLVVKCCAPPVLHLHFPKTTVSVRPFPRWLPSEIISYGFQPELNWSRSFFLKSASN